MIRRLICLISVVFLVVSHADADSATKPAAKPVVAVFDLTGLMAEQPADDSSALFGQQNPWLRDVVIRMDKAADDPAVKAVVILADYAQFGLAQASELRQAMQTVRKARKEVYGHGDLLGMEQYVLLSEASRVSVAPTGEVWAMGYYGDALYLHGLLVKLGIQPDYLHCGAYKSASEIFMRDGPSPEAEQMENWLLDSVYDTAISQIAAGRKVSEAQVRQWIDNGPYTSEKAKAVGMIDAVEDRAELTQMLRKEFGPDTVFEKRYGAEKQPELNFSNPFAMMGVFAQLMNPPKAGAGKPAVGVVYVNGPIVTGASDSNPLLGQLAASTDIAKALDQAADDNSVKAVVLRVDSPGGSATASEIILRATQRVKAKKPLVVSMGDVAGSGGYYVTCAADTVFADEATITASIGVVGGKLATTDMWNKIGVTWKAYSRGANAGLLSSDAVFTPAERQRMQAWMDEIYGVFKDHVAAIRGNKLKKPLDELDGGRVFTGKQALDLGLVDRIRTLQEAIEFAADQAKVKDYIVRTVPEPKNFLQKLMEQSSEGGDDKGRVGIGAAGNWLEKLAEPYVAGLDRQHVDMVRAGLWQLQLMQREQVMLMMPAQFCCPGGTLPH